MQVDKITDNTGVTGPSGMTVPIEQKQQLWPASTSEKSTNSEVSSKRSLDLIIVFSFSSPFGAVECNNLQLLE